MKTFYFIGKTADELRRAPFIYWTLEDVKADFDESIPKREGYRIFEVIVKEIV